jgi:guanylate kinase
MLRKGVLFVISGPSGVGKGTLKKALLENMNDLLSSISVTTREPREGERDGWDYFFVTEESFEKKIDQGELLEWARVFSNMYGTPRDFVASNLEHGQDVLLEIDVQGALQVKKKMPEAVLIFVAPPSIHELAMRLTSRAQDSAESISSRLAASEDELKQIDYYDYLLINDDINDTLAKLESIVSAERCRVKNLELR